MILWILNAGKNKGVTLWGNRAETERWDVRVKQGKWEKERYHNQVVLHHVMDMFCVSGLVSFVPASVASVLSKSLIEGRGKREETTVTIYPLLNVVRFYVLSPVSLLLFHYYYPTILSYYSYPIIVVLSPGRTQQERQPKGHHQDTQLDNGLFTLMFRSLKRTKEWTVFS